MLEKKEANRLSLVNSSKIDSHKKRIDLIGEPILKRKLLQMYNEVFGISDELLEVQTEIARLQEREKKLLIKSK